MYRYHLNGYNIHVEYRMMKIDHSLHSQESIRLVLTMMLQRSQQRLYQITFHLIVLLVAVPCLASPISRIRRAVKSRWDHATRLATLEQQIEDYNADYIASSASASIASRHRRLICLPLDTKLFNPPPGVFSYNHVQNGDKMSLPKCFFDCTRLNEAEVPYLYQLRRVDGVTQPRVEFSVDDDTISERVPLRRDLDCAVGGPIDYRAPSCYVFVPLWMMRALGLRPLDVVEVDYVDSIPKGSLVRLRPHSEKFSKIANPQAVMETELKHYSSMTAGSTIAMDYNGETYWFDVVELRSAPKGEKVPMVKLQDCDVSTDFLPSREFKLEQKRKRNQMKKDLEDEKGL